MPTVDLARWRSFAESTLVDTCTITAPADPDVGTLNTSTGGWTPAAAATLYSGPCRVRMPSIAETDDMFAGASVAKQRFVVIIAWDAADIPVGSRVTVTDSTDMQLLDRPLAVVAIRSRSNLVDRRLGVEAVE